jgi:hypothetical protein
VVPRHVDHSRLGDERCGLLPREVRMT